MNNENNLKKGNVVLCINAEYDTDLSLRLITV